MPSYSFEVENYRVSTSIRRLPSEPRARLERSLELRSVALAHGARASAGLAFSAAFNVVSSPVVGHLSSGPTGPRLIGWLPLAEFGFYYDLLRSERPIYLFYDTQPGETAGYLTKLSLQS